MSPGAIGMSGFDQPGVQQGCQEFPHVARELLALDLVLGEQRFHHFANRPPLLQKAPDARSHRIQPEILLCRVDRELPRKLKEKIAHFCNVPVAAVIGYVIFSDFPDGLALAGIAVTIAAGRPVRAMWKASRRM